MTNDRPTTEDTFTAATPEALPPLPPYEYVLWEICKSPEGILHFELRAESPLQDAPERSHRRNLLPWALNILAQQMYELGLYYATFAPTDPEGEHAAFPIESRYITWGTDAIAA